MVLTSSSSASSKLLALSPSSSSSGFYGEKNNVAREPAAQLRLLGGRKLAGKSSGPNQLVCFMKRKFLRPVVSFSSSKSLQVETRPAEVLISDQNLITVRVKLQLQKQCQFGEQFLVVGSDPVLGSWNPLEAVPMQWADGHLWTAKLDLPVEEPIMFKFILRIKSGQILWQPDSDRILHLWETTNTICVLENWENAGLQRVTEEESYGLEDELSTDTPESLVVADNLSQFRDHMVASKQLIYTDGDMDQAPFTTASLDASFHEKLQVTGNVLKAASTDSYYIANSEGLQEAESSVEGNGTVLTKWSSQNTAAEQHWDNNEEIPILVPGLTPISVSPADDALEQEIIGNSADAADVMTKLEETIEDEPDPDIFNFHHSQADDPYVPMSEPGEVTLEDKLMPEDSHLSGVEDVSDMGSEQREILENDIKWGQKTLKKLFGSVLFRHCVICDGRLIIVPAHRIGLWPPGLSFGRCY
ncbi:Glucoamylase-like protein, partial [Drosera capensis]